MPRPGSSSPVCRVLFGAALALPVLLAACSTGAEPTPAASLASPARPSSTSTASTPEPTEPDPPTSATGRSGTTGTTSPPPVGGCPARVAAVLSPEQKAGQLIMVGAQASQPPSVVDAVLVDQHVGGVTLLGSWDGSNRVKEAITHWHQQSAPAANGIRLLVSADQEGGRVQHLTGAGFTSTPSALAQGVSAAGVARTSARVGAELRAAGVTVALAPVTDTVTVTFAPQNAPIGALDREYGHTPPVVAAAVTAAVGGLQGAGVSATLKHFPGLGRITGNTDLTAAGTTDTITTADDAVIEPFRAGVEAGADLVMVSSALYPEIDPDHRAAFSPAVVTGVLRERLGFRGVVISDDVGSAQAVASVPVGERATQLIAAGGDIVLTGLPSTVPAMAGAIVDRTATDRTFASQVDAAVTRVVDLKMRRGLVTC